jgi:hypothetical protein
MNPSQHGQSLQTKAILSLFTILIIGSIIGLIVAFTSLGMVQHRVGDSQEIRIIWGSFRTNFTIDTIIICMNLSLLLGLILSYKRDFKRTQSPFLLGLLLFLSVLFIQSLLSLPILNLILSLISSGAREGFIYILLGYRSAIFGILSHFFETVALIILYYLSRE